MSEALEAIFEEFKAEANAITSETKLELPKLQIASEFQSASTIGADPCEKINRRALFDAEEQRRKQAEIQAKHSQNELKDCTFKPRINKSKTPSRNDARNVGERLYKSAEQIKQTKEKLKLQLLEAEGELLTFKPRVNGSKKLKENTQANSNVFDRLAKSTKEKINRLKNEREVEEMRECTFKPKVIPGHKKESNTTTTPVWERLSVENSFSSKKLSDLKLELERKDCTFRPRINASPSQDTLSKSVDSLGQPVWERLSQREQVKKNKTGVEEELKECTFDVRETVKNIRKEQKKEYHDKIQSYLDRVKEAPEQVILKAGLESKESGPSCFQQTLAMLTLSATKIIKNKQTKEEYEKIVDLENNATNTNKVNDMVALGMRSSPLDPHNHPPEYFQNE